MKTHRVSNRLSKCANMRYCKNQFTINSQSKLKKIQGTILEIYTKKKHCRVFSSPNALLKNETKKFLKKGGSQLKIA